MNRKILFNILEDNLNIVLTEDLDGDKRYLHFHDLKSEERFTIGVGRGKRAILCDQQWEE